MNISGKNLIGYSVSGEKNMSFTGLGGIADAYKDIVFSEATAEEIDLAVSKGDEAFQSYRLFPGKIRAAFLEKIAEGIAASREELIAIAEKETRLPQGRLGGEIGRTVNQLKLFAELLKEGSWVTAIIDTAQPDRQPLPKPDVRQMQRALGVVAVFGASNFPFAFSVAGGDTASALAAGCPVVYKAHPGHPVTSEAVGQIIVEAAKSSQMPEGVFSLLQGATHTSGIALVNHPRVKAVSFTGSLAGGRALYDAAAKRPEPIPVYAEMGSINPVFILPEMMEQKGAELAENLAMSNRLGAGQFCTNPGVMVSVQSDTAANFLAGYEANIKSAISEPMLTDKIVNGYYAGIRKLAGAGSVKQRAGKIERDASYLAVPHMFEVSASDFLKKEELMEEVFGPSAIHVVAGEKIELTEVARKLQGQLTITVWGTEKDLDDHRDLLHILELKTGRLIINGVPTGVEVTHAMVHGGPYPATTDSRSTSVGTNAIYRFTRPVCYQNFPGRLLPEELVDANPLGILRKVNGSSTKAAI